jgi:hypothetical protein
MKKIIFLFVLLFILCSCGPSFTIRKIIKGYEKSQCNYPLTYKSSLNWKIYSDSIQTYFNVFDKKLNKWVINYEPVKIIFHSYSSKNLYGIPSNEISKSIIYKDGKIETQ